MLCNPELLGGHAASRSADSRHRCEGEQTIEAQQKYEWLVAI